MKSLTLYEMSQQYQFLLDDLYDIETGVVNEDTLDKLNKMSVPIEEKCINIAKLFQSIETTHQAIKIEKERLAKREKSFKHQVDRLKQYLFYNMQACKMSKIECPQFTISLQKNPPSVDVLSVDDIPKIYDKHREREIDLRAVLSDLKEGKDVPGATLVQKQSVRIR